MSTTRPDFLEFWLSIFNTFSVYDLNFLGNDGFHKIITPRGKYFFYYELIMQSLQAQGPAPKEVNMLILSGQAV